MPDICEVCGEWLVGEWTMAHHRCPPRWRVWCPDYEGDDPEQGEVVFAGDAEEAATKWAGEQSENHEMIDSPRTVKVMCEDDFAREPREWVTFVVHGEATINFYASEVSDGE
jgi:hypothetical protein